MQLDLNATKYVVLNLEWKQVGQLSLLDLNSPFMNGTECQNNNIQRYKVSNFSVCTRLIMRVKKKAPVVLELFSGCFLCVVSAVAANNKVVSDGTHGGYRTLLRSFDGILPRVLSAAEHLLASPVSCLLCGVTIALDNRFS